MNLPNDIIMHIYTFLKIKEIKKIEKNEYYFKKMVYIQNKTVPENHNRIYKNVIENKCFNCSNKLNPNYIINICGFCKYIIDGEELYPMYCNKCIKFKTKKEFMTRPCLICNNWTVFLGVSNFS